MKVVSGKEIMEWHTGRGGFAGRPAGHALRILREVVELCIAAGASKEELYEAMDAEVKKAEGRMDFHRDPAHRPADILEEFVDVNLLMMVFRRYFINLKELFAEERRKLEVCRGRAWEADADGVLWRPGTRGAGTVRGSAESS